MMKKFLVAVPVVMLAVGSTACATKKFVRTEVGAVNDKVTTLTTRMEENEQRIKANEEKIGKVDSKVGQVDQTVGQVDQKASAAGQSADAAQDGGGGGRCQGAEDRRHEPQARVRRRAERGVGRLQVLEGAAAGRSEGAARQAGDGPVRPIRRRCSSRSKATRIRPVRRRINEAIGLERAEAVKRYLYEQHNVPLHKISVISYGETKPVDSNRTRDGRAKNRRVEVKVSSPESDAAAATTARTGA